MLLERFAKVGALGLILCCPFITGCFFRTLTEQEVVGTYEAHADWGKSTLVLRPDHRFEQTVVRDDHTQASIKGTWRLDPVEKSAPLTIIALQPYLDVKHDHKGDLMGGAANDINRGFLWGVSIAADPDYGISFDKK